MNISILVSSCDKYSELWDPFFYLFFRYWNDCPYDIYLLSNDLRFPDRRIQTITVGKDRGWATNLMTGLGTITTSYLLYMQEDYFIKSKVRNLELVKLVDQISDLNPGYLRLQPNPKPNLPSPIDSVGEISKKSPYRVSLQAAIWNKQTLYKLLVPGESGWDMEISGSERSNHLDELFLSVKSKPYIPYLWRTAIQKGRWTFDAQVFCFLHGVQCSNATFGKESFKDWFEKKRAKSIREIKRNLRSS